MGVYTMKKLKCMLETSYSIDAIFYLRKSSILVSLVFLIILSIMQMTPTAFVLIGDAPYRWDLNVWDISESSQHLLEDNLPDDCVVNNYKLSCKQSLDIVLQNEVRVAFNLPTSTVRNGLIFNEDHFLFVIDDMNYKFDYSKFEGVDFSNITYDEMFMRVASTHVYASYVIRDVSVRDLIDIRICFNSLCLIYVIKNRAPIVFKL